MFLQSKLFINMDERFISLIAALIKRVKPNELDFVFVILNIILIIRKLKMHLKDGKYNYLQIGKKHLLLFCLSRGFKRKNMEYLPERRNPHLFCIVCYI